jgi:uncharacterized Rmd1/YagE family protein
MMKNNFVRKHMHLTSKPSVVPQKRRSLQSEATLRDAREEALNELECSQTITFESGSEVHWGYSEDSLQGSLNDIGSSSISIDIEED